MVIVISMKRLIHLGKDHWFYGLVGPIFGGAYLLHTQFNWGAHPAYGERLALLLWCLITPLLFAICYRAMPRRALLVRLTSLLCGGAWLAGATVPDQAEQFLKDWEWLRYLGLGLILVVEGLALIAVLRILFGGKEDEAELTKQGIPPLVAKMMLAELRFWRWLWSRLTGKKE
jgi:hypothetical protein